MSQQKVAHGQPDEAIHLRLQNDQLWKIIEKQRVMIQSLQKDNARLAAERDGLYDKVDNLEREIIRKPRVASILISPQAMKEIAESEEAMTPVDGFSSPTDSVVSNTLTRDLSHASPMPPPRSPYRSFKESAKMVEVSELVQVAHKEQLQHQRPKQLNFSLENPMEFQPIATSPAPTPVPTPAGDVDGMCCLSPPGSPIPGQITPTSPHCTIIEKDALLFAKYQTANGPKKDHPKSVPMSRAATASPPPCPSSPSAEPRLFVPPQSKSTSTLDNRRTGRARDSMMPPPRTALEHDPTVRAASPPPTSYTGQQPFSDSMLSLHVPTGSPNRKRESKIYYNTPIDLVSPNDLGQEEWPAMRVEMANGPPEVPFIQEPYLASPLSAEQLQDGMNSLAADGIANISIKVVGSNIKTNDRGKEVISFTISVGKKHPGSEEDFQPEEEYEELWRVEKLYSDFLGLDSKLKTQRNRAIAGRIGKLPDKALFATNAPSKVDLRKHALEVYLQHIVSLPMEDITDLCNFLSTNVIERETFRISGHKEGFLTKRGKNFGGWKTRYFVLNGPMLDYFESKDGIHLGTIRLTNAQIGRQTPGMAPVDEFNAYRHAFLIVEKKRPGSSHVNRHILCAVSDEDRDEWVDVLFQNIVIDEKEIRKDEKIANEKKKKAEKPRKLSKGEIRTIGATPISNLKLEHPADVEKLTNVPNMQTPNPSLSDSTVEPIPITSNLTPSISSESTDSSILSTSLPSVPPTGWPGIDAQHSHPHHHQPHPSYTVRTSFDQPPSRNLHPRPVLQRRSSMANLVNEEEDSVLGSIPTEQRTVSPAIGSCREAEESTENLLDLPDNKKTKNKANRMTFWGKKMFSSSSGQQETVPPSMRPSTSTENTSRGSALPNPSSGFRNFLSRTSNESGDRPGRGKTSEDGSHKPSKQVFRVPLEEAVRVSRVSEKYELPAVVFRCIEYLDAKNAVLEEGLYRLSGSNMMMKSLKERFDQEGDVNLLASKEEYDVHAIAGLLKMWLRELPTSVLTREHRTDFLHVIDLLDRKDRVNELGRLVSLLPLANYTLLRALTAHLICVVQNSDVNKMTMRNVSIVFAPTLGIPATIFNLFMSEFEYIFWTTEEGDAAPRMLEDEEKQDQEEQQQQGHQQDQDQDQNQDQGQDQGQDRSEEHTIQITECDPVAPLQGSVKHDSAPSSRPALGRRPTLKLREEHGRSNRNSVNYIDGAPIAIVDLEMSMDGPPMLDEEEEEVDDLALAVTEDEAEHCRYPAEKHI
ncbi:hypothetical protein CLU79DRAFT_778495 [Phycomyces nitens]|nr:hypothetical protein CLU79DRAFT_778495 [Phycomyces nitens]